MARLLLLLLMVVARMDHDCPLIRLLLIGWLH
jgi:hypothetical protein